MKSILREWKELLAGLLFFAMFVGIISCTTKTTENRDTSDSLNTAVIVTERYTLDFPEGSCGGFSRTGIRWTAPEAMVMDIEGGAWRARVGRQGVIFSMWVKGEPIIKNILLYGTSKSPYTFGRMLADQKTGSSGGQDFVQLVSQQGEDDSLLKNISFEKGDEIYIKVEAGNFIGLNLKVLVISENSG